MVLPLLGGLAGTALAGTGLAGTMGLAGLSPLLASALGSGLGSFIETGDFGKAATTGLASLAGGHVLGNMASGAAGLGSGAAGAGGAAASGAGAPGFLAENITQGVSGLAGDAAGSAASSGMFGGALGGAKDFLTNPANVKGMIGAVAGPAMTYEPAPLESKRKDEDVRRGFDPGPARYPGGRMITPYGERDYGFQPNYRMQSGGRVGGGGGKSGSLGTTRRLQGFPSKGGAGPNLVERGAEAQRAGTANSSMAGSGNSTMAQSAEAVRRGGLPPSMQQRGWSPTQRMSPMQAMPTSRMPSFAQSGMRQAPYMQPRQQQLFSRGPQQGFGGKGGPRGPGGFSNMRAQQGYGGKGAGAYNSPASRIMGSFRMQDGGLTTMAQQQMQQAPQPEGERAATEAQVLKNAVAAIQGQHPEPEIALANYVQVFGRESLPELVSSVRRGDFDRNREQADSLVRGPDVGEDMVPARNVDTGQEVLLEDGEFVMNKDATANIGPEVLEELNREYA